MTELSFKGNEFVYNHHLPVPVRPLEMHADKGNGDPSLDGKLIIQGDNLHALKARLTHLTLPLPDDPHEMAATPVAVLAPEGAD